MEHPILIMGATSGIGRLAMQQGLERGLQIRAFARSADSLEDMPNLEKHPGDARDAADVAQALQGARCVIFALGIKERLSMLWEKETLFSDATTVLLNEMPKADVSRLIAVTGFGAGRSKAAMSAVEKIGHRALLGRPYDDKDRQEALITASTLDWTIARPVILTNNKKSGNIRVLTDPATWRNGLVSRADVATYLLDAATQGLNIRQDVVLAR